MSNDTTTRIDVIITPSNTVQSITSNATTNNAATGSETADISTTSSQDTSKVTTAGDTTTMLSTTEISTPGATSAITVKTTGNAIETSAKTLFTTSEAPTASSADTKNEKTTTSVTTTTPETITTAATTTTPETTTTPATTTTPETTTTAATTTTPETATATTTTPEMTSTPATTTTPDTTTTPATTTTPETTKAPATTTTPDTTTTTATTTTPETTTAPATTTTPETTTTPATTTTPEITTTPVTTTTPETTKAPATTTTPDTTTTPATTTTPETTTTSATTTTPETTTTPVTTTTPETTKAPATTTTPDTTTTPATTTTSETKTTPATATTPDTTTAPATTTTPETSTTLATTTTLETTTTPANTTTPETTTTPATTTTPETTTTPATTTTPETTTTPATTTTPETTTTPATTIITTVQTTTVRQDECSLTNDRCPNRKYCISKNTGNICKCKPRYNEDANGNCKRIRRFGGRCHFATPFNTQLRVRTSPIFLYFERIALIMLRRIFIRIRIVRFIIIRFRPGSTVVEYTIESDDEEVNSEKIENEFSEFLTNTTNFPDHCDCGSTQCNSTIVEEPLLANASCQDTGQLAEILCESSDDVSGYCDNSTTTCSANSDGDIACLCKDGFYQTDNDTRVCIQAFCQDDSNCNAPYGTCDLSTRTCSCSWGFSGNNCEEAAVFAVVITICCLLFIGICVAAYYFRKRQLEREMKISSVDLNRTNSKRNMRYNAWDTEGPVTPLSVSAIGVAQSRSNPTQRTLDSVSLPSTAEEDGDENFQNINENEGKRSSTPSSLTIVSDSLSEEPNQNAMSSEQTK